MNASPIPRMASTTRTVPGWRLASHAVYPHPRPRPRPRRPALAAAPALHRLPLALPGGPAARPAAVRLLLAHLPVRHLLAPAPRPLPRDRPPGPARLATPAGRTGTPPQPRPGRRPAARPAP